MIEDRFEELNSRLDIEFNPLNSDNVREVYKTREYIRQELSKGCKISLKKHFLISDFKSFQIYKEFIENIHKFIKDEDIDIDKLKMNTLFNLENKAVEFEDLSSLMYIKYRLIGAKEYTKYRQVVVDEAQDLGAFHFFILKLMMKDASFSIFGDLAQAIYPYRSIENWDEVISVLKDKCHFLKLNKSYRTTIEIMHKANLIIEHIGLDIAEPVIRHGKDVEIFKIKNKDILNKIKDTIEDMQNEGHKTIAIITKTLKEADEICKKLSKMNILIHNIEKENEEFESGVCILTSFMAKGLEFDGVIITNASESNYKNDNILDMKLLYVSITRSLHRLVLLHDDDITKIFKNLGNH